MEHRKHVSDGSTASYYAIPPGAKELSDCIEYKNMNFQVGNIFKACYRLGEKEGTDLEYDIRKMGFFWIREMFRLGIDPRAQLRMMLGWSDDKFDGALNNVDLDQLLAEGTFEPTPDLNTLFDQHGDGWVATETRNEFIPAPRYANKAEITDLLKPDAAGWYNSTTLRPLHDAMIDVFTGGVEGNVVTDRCDKVNWDTVLLWRYTDLDELI